MPAEQRSLMYAMASATVLKAKSAEEQGGKLSVIETVLEGPADQRAKYVALSLAPSCCLRRLSL